MLLFERHQLVKKAVVLRVGDLGIRVDVVETIVLLDLGAELVVLLTKGVGNPHGNGDLTLWIELRDLRGRLLDRASGCLAQKGFVMSIRGSVGDASGVL